VAVRSHGRGPAAPRAVQEARARVRRSHAVVRRRPGRPLRGDRAARRDGGAGQPARRRATPTCDRRGPTPVCIRGRTVLPRGRWAAGAVRHASRVAPPPPRHWSRPES
jgi:hypothetical protein